MQLLMTNVEEEILAARIRRAQTQMNELVSELEMRALTRDELSQRVKEVERDLRKTRAAF